MIGAILHFLARIVQGGGKIVKILAFLFFFNYNFSAFQG